MGVLKKYLKQCLEIFISSIYLSLELFVFLLISIFYSYNQSIFSNTIIIFIVLFFNFIYFFKILIYFNLFSILNKTTKDLFIKYENNSFENIYNNINPYTIEATIQNTNLNMNVCSICKTIKPERAQHCEYLNRCFLKYDHYSRFLSVPIGYHNYKLYYQFITINLISSILIFLLLLLEYIFNDNNFFPRTNYIIASSIVFVFLIISLFTFIYHTFLISNNETSYEFKRIQKYIKTNDLSYLKIFKTNDNLKNKTTKSRKKINPYNISIAVNWRQVFGNKKIKWFIPQFSSLGDGITFPVNFDS